MSEMIYPRVRINCTKCHRPNIVVNTYYEIDSESESESDPEYDPRDSESDSETDYDSDGSFVSEDESETEASLSEDEESESESESDADVGEVKPYYGQGFRVYFDSIKDRRHFMRAFGFD
jgi:hypothetical protein